MRQTLNFLGYIHYISQSPAVLLNPNLSALTYGLPIFLKKNNSKDIGRTTRNQEVLKYH